MVPRHARRSGSRPVRRYSRLDILRYGFIILGGLIVIRLFTVQILHNSYYTALAFNNHELFQDLFPERGDILVQDPYSATGTAPIVTNRALAEVHAEPIHIQNPQTTAEALSPILHITVADLITQLDKPNDPDEILKRRVPEEVVAAIAELNLPGITFRQEQWRYYPEGEYTAHLTGYFGYSDEDRKGQYGVEGYFDTELAGTPGFLKGEKDALGRFLTIGDSFIEQAIDGDDVVLTIDKNVQFYACERLKAQAEKLTAKEGTVIVLQPKTGAVIAMCNYPSYDPNTYNQVESIDVFINSAVSDEYEAGSVIKAITMAAGLDRGVVSPTTTYNDVGQIVIDGYHISNFDGKAYGSQTMTSVLENSLNLGAIFVAQQVGNEALYQYIHNFGFGESTGIELLGEHDGDVAELSKLKDIYSATASYGHGFTVTPIQLAAAYGAIANNGQLMKPYVVAERQQPSGDKIVTQPQPVRQVISAATAKTLTAMLVNVIDYGHAKRAQVPGYFLAGKTGTALVATASGYDAHRHNDTFVGFGPVSDPQFVLLVKMNEPNGVQYAEGSVVPVWGEIAQYLVNYYQIPPDRQ
ncbi:MAG: penicillin-binding protein 2 [Candidatus Kerfeldbacteria bacterium]|nr:penicillin-binding protein 2 [Candidatus Kerfeldbacteria bacterium]